VKVPHPVRSAKSSTISPSQYCGGGPRGNPGCCSCLFSCCHPFWYNISPSAALLQFIKRSYWSDKCRIESIILSNGKNITLQGHWVPCCCHWLVERSLACFQVYLRRVPETFGLMHQSLFEKLMMIYSQRSPGDRLLLTLPLYWRA
jgi:hypothetical protein